MVQRSHENGEFEDREWGKERLERHDNWGGHNEGADHTREIRERESEYNGIMEKMGGVMRVY